MRRILVADDHVADDAVCTGSPRVVTSSRRSCRVQFPYAEYLAVAGAEALERILAG